MKNPTCFRAKVVLLSAQFLAALLVPACFSGPAHADNLLYERDIHPILKAHCFHCHGEEGVREGGLDLRLRRLAVAGGDSGEAIVPGHPEQSYLVERLELGEMPPDDKLVPEHEIELIRQWIAAGAPTEYDEPDEIGDGEFYTHHERQFWSFQPIVRPELPSVANTSMVRNAIDPFVLSRLESLGLVTSPEATRYVLIRRLYFDLLGVPPSPEEVTAFVQDASPNAYEKLVDRLLASPMYGERWGRHWLDVAGYADSEGYVDADPVREFAYFYRDYVIEAFNDDMPFDQFVIEQLAGDELVERPYENLTTDEIRRLTATGLLRMAPDGTGAGGVDQNVARNEVIAETLNIVSSSLLGLTVGCARCHNHRYDPISQRDYYELRAIFEPALDWKAWRRPNDRRISLYQDADRIRAQEIEATAQVAVESRSKVQQAHLDRTLEEELIKAPDELRNALREAYKTTTSDRTEDQIALLKQYPNIQNISSGSLYLYSQQRGRRANEIQAVADAKEETFIQRVRQSTMDSLDPDSRTLATEALAQEESNRTPQQQELLAAHPGLLVDGTTLEQFDPDGAALVADYRAAAETCRQTDSNKELEDLQSEIDAIRATIPKEYFIRALTEPEGHHPDTFVFYRGNHTQPKDEVAPSELDILIKSNTDSIPIDNVEIGTSGRRLHYARHLTDGDHPLLARVIVNRVWMHHFGRGLVATPADFGLLGERPSHPELLDWLAHEFMESGWQIKQLHRLILMSHTYRQDSRRTETLEEIDPDNRLLARQSIRRIEAEVLRDSILIVSGQFVDEMRGPPIPVMEDGVGQIVIGQEDLDGERKPREASSLMGNEHRRSVYVQVRRSRPLAALETFDLALMTPNCTQRPVSNVALQPLFLMNSDVMIRYAQGFADRVIHRTAPGLENQLREAWLLAYGELPDELAMASLRRFAAMQNDLLGPVGDGDQSARDREILAIVCQALMAANRFLYID